MIGMKVTMKREYATKLRRQPMINPNCLNGPHVEGARFSHFPP
jgi:hypothetical protein